MASGAPITTKRFARGRQQPPLTQLPSFLDFVDGRFFFFLPSPFKIAKKKKKSSLTDESPRRTHRTATATARAHYLCLSALGLAQQNWTQQQQERKNKAQSRLNNGDCESSANPTGVQNDNCGPASGPLVGVSSQLYD